MLKISDIYCKLFGLECFCEYCVLTLNIPQILVYPRQYLSRSAAAAGVVFGGLFIGQFLSMFPPATRLSRVASGARCSILVISQAGRPTGGAATSTPSTASSSKHHRLNKDSQYPPCRASRCSQLFQDRIRSRDISKSELSSGPSESVRPHNDGQSNQCIINARS
jgi:hypothetical protein